MKNRDYKIFLEGEYYHIFNRGVGKMDIFKDVEDYTFFLARVRETFFPEEYKKRMTLLDSKEGHPLHTGYVRKILPSGAFSMIYYCLMPNHFHLVVRQLGDIEVGKFISKICTSYSMYFNKKYKRVGSLYQDRFKAVLVDNDEYLLWLSVYVHQNPKVAGLVKNLKDWKWSSYLDYVGARQGSLCHKDVVLQRFKDAKEYEFFVDSGFDIMKEKEELKDLLLDN